MSNITMRVAKRNVGMRIGMCIGMRLRAPHVGMIISVSVGMTKVIICKIIMTERVKCIIMIIGISVSVVVGIVVSISVSNVGVRIGMRIGMRTTKCRIGMTINKCGVGMQPMFVLSLPKKMELTI